MVVADAAAGAAWGPVPPTPTPPPVAPPPEAPRLRREGLGYVLEVDALGVRLRADYLRERSDELGAEVTVESTLPGVPPHLHQARMNLSVGKARTDLAKHLAALAPVAAGGGRGAPGDEAVRAWARVVEQFCVAVIRRERQGEPVVRVGRLPGEARTRDLIERLLPRGKPTLWYGPPGAGKGWMAALACVAVETGTALAGLAVQRGHALYLDWEDSADTLNARVQALACGLRLDAAPEVAYRQCRRTLARDLHTIARCAADTGPLERLLIVVDSVGLAAGAAGERGSYEDVALALFDALRHLEPATVLCIDHVNSEALKSGQLAGKAFGSVYKKAEARCQWEIRADQEAGAEETHLGFYHTKHNHSIRYGAIGFCLGFAPTAPGDPPAWVTVAREDVRASAVLGQHLSLPERLKGALGRGARSVKELADELEEPDNKLRTVLNRGLRRTFTRMQDGRWALIYRDPSEYLRPVAEPAPPDPDDADGDDGEAPF